MMFLHWHAKRRGCWVSAPSVLQLSWQSWILKLKNQSLARRSSLALTMSQYSWSMEPSSLSFITRPYSSLRFSFSCSFSDSYCRRRAVSTLWSPRLRMVFHGLGFMSTDMLPRQFLYSMRSLFAVEGGASLRLGSCFTSYRYSSPFSFGFSTSSRSLSARPALACTSLSTLSSTSRRLPSSTSGANFAFTCSENCLTFSAFARGFSPSSPSAGAATQRQKTLWQEGRQERALDPFIFFSISLSDSFCLRLSSTRCSCSRISCRLIGCFSCRISASFFFLSSSTSSSRSPNCSSIRWKSSFFPRTSFTRSRSARPAASRCWLRSLIRRTDSSSSRLSLARSSSRTLCCASSACAFFSRDRSLSSFFFASILLISSSNSFRHSSLLWRDCPSPSCADDLLLRKSYFSKAVREFSIQPSLCSRAAFSLPICSMYFFRSISSQEERSGESNLALRPSHLDVSVYDLLRNRTRLLLHVSLRYVTSLWLRTVEQFLQHRAPRLALPHQQFYNNQRTYHPGQVARQGMENLIDWLGFVGREGVKWGVRRKGLQVIVLLMNKNFNIQETVHRNIEKNQFPSFANHRSLVGWCSMNYPKVLQNPIYIQKDTSTETQKYDIDSLFQQRNPVDRTKNEFVKPFSNDDKGVHTDTKTSCFTLATSKHDNKVRIFEENNKISEEFSSIRPLGSILGGSKDGNYERKVRQIGEVYYNPPVESELMRHLKKLPNTVINQHNLLEIMDQRLEYLDLQYKGDISNDLINKIGYLAPNIRELNLTAVPITNEVLIELGISCRHLEAIDVSLCPALEEFAVIKFFEKKRLELKKFSANHNDHCITDAALRELENCKLLNALQINFCHEVTSAGLQGLAKRQFVELGLAGLPGLKGEDFLRVIASSAESLRELDMSFNGSKEVGNALMIRVGMCPNLRTLVLTGCENITDEGMNNLIYGDKLKGKAPEGFEFLQTLKLGGLANISDQLYQLLKRCPALTFLECNNLERLSDHFLDQLKTLTHIRTVLMNFTPNISEEKLKEVRESTKGTNFIRNIIKMTDPADDGLRMPIPPASMKIKKPKKKKK